MINYIKLSCHYRIFNIICRLRNIQKDNANNNIDKVDDGQIKTACFASVFKNELHKS